MSIWVKVEAGGREAVMEGMERVALGNLVARGALGWGRGLLVMGFWAGRWGREVGLDVADYGSEVAVVGGT